MAPNYLEGRGKGEVEGGRKLASKWNNASPRACRAGWVFENIFGLVIKRISISRSSNQTRSPILAPSLVRLLLLCRRPRRFPLAPLHDIGVRLVSAGPGEVVPLVYPVAAVEPLPLQTSLVYFCCSVPGAGGGEPLGRGGEVGWWSWTQGKRASGPLYLPLPVPFPPVSLQRRCSFRPA